MDRAHRPNLHHVTRASATRTSAWRLGKRRDPALHCPKCETRGHDTVPVAPEKTVSSRCRPGVRARAEPPWTHTGAGWGTALLPTAAVTDRSATGPRASGQIHCHQADVGR